MPLVRIGYGLMIVGLIAIAAIIATMFMAQKAEPQTIIAMLGFAGTVIGGVMVAVKKLEDIEEAQEHLKEGQAIAAARLVSTATALDTKTKELAVHLAAKTEEATAKTGEQIGEVKHAMNSRLDELLAAVKAEAFEAGAKSERDRPK